LTKMRRLDWLIPTCNYSFSYSPYFICYLWSILIGLEDVDAYSQSIDEDMISVYYTIIVNLLICVICVLAFSLTRKYSSPTFRNNLYSPKADIVPEKTPIRLQADSLFGWIHETWRYVSLHSPLNIAKYASNSQYWWHYSCGERRIWCHVCRTLL